MASVPNRMVLLAQKLLYEKADTGAFAARRLPIQSTPCVTDSDCGWCARIGANQRATFLYRAAKIHIGRNSAEIAQLNVKLAVVDIGDSLK